MYFMRWSSLFVTSVKALLIQFAVLDHTCWWGTISDVVIFNLFRAISLLRERVYKGGKNLRVARLTRSGQPGFSPQHLTVRCSCRFYDSTARKSKVNFFSFIKIKAQEGSYFAMTLCSVKAKYSISGGKHFCQMSSTVVEEWCCKSIYFTSKTFWTFLNNKPILPGLFDN